MQMLSRLALGLATSVALSAAPASAGGWYGSGHGGYGGGYHHHGGNGGDVVAALIGGLLVGGIVSAAASANQPKPAPYYNAPPQGYVQPGYVQPGYNPQSYQRPGAAQPADAASAQVELCSRAAERAAQGYGGYARVVSIEGINGDQGNAEVRGTLEIARNSGATRTGFSCGASFGQVTGVRLG